MRRFLKTLALLCLLSSLIACATTGPVRLAEPGIDDFVEPLAETGDHEEEGEKGPAYVVVDTNQRFCYDNERAMDCSPSNYYGQDAQYTGTHQDYTVNGDGTVTDRNTGLVWQRDPGEKQDYQAAIAGADTFALAGHDDWRVPTIKELYSLIDFSGSDIDAASRNVGNPFINDDVFTFHYGDPETERIIDSQWVTSTTYTSTVMNGEECFFGVNFADGRIKCYPTRKGKGYYALYVRGGRYGENDLEDNGDGTITDTATGLTWQQNDSGTGMNWRAALNHCENLALVGEIDWRLPNAKELQSIVDYTRAPDTTRSAAIDPLFTVTRIKNEARQDDYPYYWTSTTHANQQGGSQAVYIAFGRALGKMNGDWMDVHGAGAQRSDPKAGDASDYPDGFGPQGDARRIENHVRCVRGGAEMSDDTKPASEAPIVKAPPEEKRDDGVLTGTTPPPEAIEACDSKYYGGYCTFQSPKGKVVGSCYLIQDILACVPEDDPFQK